MQKNIENCDRNLPTPSQNTPCHHCDGKGYIQIRDCSGEIQREENCSFCEGTGVKSSSTMTTGN
ncbi:hypothetical protein [Pseudanabaena mucicola]|uniref:hypothetical protein n=1 Tax=Pseudanabaena mucicola TaxID=71190 RepID=UPI00168038BD|nr:hypothetical protein [Pseudanabaena mucicola]